MFIIVIVVFRKKYTVVAILSFLTATLLAAFCYICIRWLLDIRFTALHGTVDRRLNCLFVCLLICFRKYGNQNIKRQNYNNTIIIHPRRHKDPAGSYQCPRYKSSRLVMWQSFFKNMQRRCSDNVHWQGILHFTG